MKWITEHGHQGLSQWGRRFLVVACGVGLLRAWAGAEATPPGRIVTSYALTVARTSDFPDPQDWRLLGSTDGQSWTLLDEQTNQASWAEVERRQFTVSNRAAYGWYRLEVLNTPAVQLAELELLGPPAGVAGEDQLKVIATSSQEHPLFGPAGQAFDHDPDTAWVDFGTPQRMCWLQCQYTTSAAVTVSNIAQCTVMARRRAARNPLVDQAPQILSNLTAQAGKPVRTLIGYALTSANDVPARDPKDWRLLGSNDGGKTWRTLDSRHGESFTSRLERRTFLLTNEVAYALYRLEISSVLSPRGANAVQLAELEPLYAEHDHATNTSMVVLARGEHPPMEVATLLFDGNASTKWLDFGESGNTNRSSWIQWQYLPGGSVPVISLRQLRTLRSQPPRALSLDLPGVVVGLSKDSGALGVVDETGFEWFKLSPPPAAAVSPGERIRLCGRLRLDGELPVVEEAVVTRLGRVPTLWGAPAGESAVNAFAAGDLRGRVESVSQEAGQLHLRLTGTAGKFEARLLNSPPTSPLFFAGCSLRLKGVAQTVFDNAGRRVPALVWVSDLEQVSLSMNGAKDWSDWPKYTLPALWRTNNPVPAGCAVRATGTLRESVGGGRVLQDRGLELALELRPDQPLPTGQMVEAVGFLDRRGIEPALGLAQLRPLSTEAFPEGTGQPSGPAPAAGPATSVREIYDRLAARPAMSFPVKIRGVITYIDLGLGSWYLQDGDEGMFVKGQMNAGLAPLLNQEGAYVEVEGTVDTNRMAVVPSSFVKVLGRGLMPEPRRSTWDSLISGKDDAHWVGVEGVVSACQGSRLTLTIPGGRLAVWVNSLDKDAPSRLLGSLVRACGVCDALRNSRNRRLGVRLVVPSEACLELLRPRPRDPFALTTYPLGRILESVPRGGDGAINLVKTAGVVTHKEPHLLFIQENEEGLCVVPRGEAHVEPGDRVEAVGFAEPGGFSPKLVQAVVRKVGRQALPTPVLLQWLEAEPNRQDAIRVRLEATFLGSSARESIQVLSLEEPGGERHFSAILPVVKGTVKGIRPGSRLRLEGVFKTETDALPDFAQVLTSYQLYLNSPDDVTVLYAATWWTARHTWLLSGGAGAMVLLALGWVGLLRNQVRRRTRELRHEIEEHRKTGQALAQSEFSIRSLVDSLPLSILHKDLEGRFTFVNEGVCRSTGKAMNQILGKTDFDLFPRELAEKYRRDDANVTSMGKQLETVEENRNPAGDRTFVQVIKLPLYDPNRRVIGLQVIFWDVTERKLAELRLEEAHKGLVEASRQAGMAEVATGVLHNVGNVLNSVNVSAGLVNGTLKRSRVAGLAKAVAMIREHEPDLGSFFDTDPRGRQVVDYLGHLADHLEAERATTIKELEELTANVEHIKEIVAMQQSYAKVVGITEMVRITDLVEDALRLNASALARHDIRLIRDFQGEPPEFPVERHKVLQILINLIRNAKYACDATGRSDKCMTVGVAATPDVVRISITDNGVGIAPENLTRIFNHGFTTRKDGHGFGLHSGALAAREMGGRLFARSDGPGRGATFTLELVRSRKP